MTAVDFCVVGGGPAGLALSLLLLRSGATVALVERSRTLDREYRGEILQPGGARILDALGVLSGIRERGAYPLSGFQFLAGGATVLDVDYTALPGPHNHLLSLPQRHLLAELLDECGRYPGFTHLAGSRVRELLTDGGRVTGVVADEAVSALCVIGADGRYSKVRQLAGIDTTRLDVFDQDLLWFKLTAPADRRPGRVQIHRGEGGAVLVHDSYPDRVQLGWTLPHQGYAAIAERGVEYVRAMISRTVPQYADLIAEQVTDLKDLTLLDVFAATATEWVRDGLVLIGDAGHTHGPLGAQGINLALQDAALVHPVLMAALAKGEAGADTLGEFVTARRPDVERVMQVQLAQAKGMLAGPPGPGGPAGPPGPGGPPGVGSPPAGADLTSWIAFGNPAIRVHSDLFVDHARRG
ncbi:FAD-dependent oxidoreductase [Longispora fulva]|uniref:Monooxygenase n=1 Tax=Longispora fulva TaxID=619741 RepID=A0A8J7KIK9_9ACTN|nr:FAD-dependent monooxygenase [Longispora fulva]MBG6134196.1 monooxygenase [Longispora fulva]GIG63088.1 FAD-dependent oxidoreductase [Longispora fulva]